MKAVSILGLLLAVSSASARGGVEANIMRAHDVGLMPADHARRQRVKADKICVTN